jgi:hypothetical protein
LVPRPMAFRSSEGTAFHYITCVALRGAQSACSPVQSTDDPKPVEIMAQRSDVEFFNP